MKKRPTRPDRPDDPMAAAQRILDNDPAYQAGVQRNRNRKDLRSVPARSASGFPERPPEIHIRVWRLTEHWLACGEKAGMRRAVSPWRFAKELDATIKDSRSVKALFKKHGRSATGADVVEDLIRRMTELFWRDYIDVSTTRYQAVDLFLDEYWEDLLDRVQSQARLERTLARMAAGTLKPVPNTVTGSLLNDPERQAVMAEIRTQAFLRKHPELLEDDDPALALRRSPEETKKLLATTAEWLRSEKAKRDAEPGSESG